MFSGMNIHLVKGELTREVLWFGSKSATYFQPRIFAKRANTHSPCFTIMPLTVVTFLDGRSCSNSSKNIPLHIPIECHEIPFVDGFIWI